MLYRYEVKIDNGKDIEQYGFFSSCDCVHAIADAINVTLLALNIPCECVSVSKNIIKNIKNIKRKEEE